MAKLGHDIVWPADVRGQPELGRLHGCDVVHVFRCANKEVQKAVAELEKRGTPITYDNDDDLSNIAKGTRTYERQGGLTGVKNFGETLKVARRAALMTTTTEPLAERYRRAGVERIVVIGNYLASHVLRPQYTHKGIVIGWLAGIEHVADARALRMRDALQTVMDRHDQVRMECIGVDLKLTGRYTHHPHVPFEDLPGKIGGWDIGIAPLADESHNHTRSNIKVKEYAASGLAWLASPAGPYLGLGEAEGGRLVPDDAWVEALDRLVSKTRERKRLARKARRWAKSQMIEAVAQQWEEVFATAAERA